MADAKIQYVSLARPRDLHPSRAASAGYSNALNPRMLIHRF
jgi:hypothetical protein